MDEKIIGKSRLKVQSFFKNLINNKQIMGSCCSVIDTNTDEKGLISGGDLFLVQGKELQSSIHSLIGAITFVSTKKLQGIGSCTLLSSDCLLTAAHNFFDLKEQKQYSGFKFYFGDSKTNENYYQIESWRYSQKFKQSVSDEKLQYDYALAKLQKPIQQSTFLQLQQCCPDCLLQDKNSFVQIYGYPVYKDNLKSTDKYGEKKSIKQYGVSRKNSIQKVDRYKITYRINTFPGQSGCPIIVSNKIIGIHSGAGKEGQQFNIGRFVTKDMLQTLKKWSKQLKTQAFKATKYQCQHSGETKNFPTLQDAQKIFKRAQSSYNNQKYSLATNEFLQCLAIQEQIKGKGHLSTASTLTHVGASYEKQNNYSQALKHYFQSNKIYQKHKKNQQIDICQNLNNIGWVYYKQQRYVQSIKKYSKCLEILTSKGSKGQLCAAVMCNLGIALLQNQNYRQAVKFHRQSLLIYEELNRPQWVKTNALHIIKCLKAIKEFSKMEQIIKLYSLEASQI